MNNILIICCEFPPFFSSQSIQIGRLLNSIIKKKEWNFLIFCKKLEKYDNCDLTILPLFNKRGRITNNCFCVEVRHRHKFWLHLLGYIRSIRVPLSYVLDLYSWWGINVYYSILRFLRKNSLKIGLLISFGYPWTDHIIGLMLKKRLKIPWIAHFSDPWLLNPYNEVDRFSYNLIKHLEYSIIQYADRVIFTSRETLNTMVNFYKDLLTSKAYTFPHSYDDRHINKGKEFFMDSRKIFRYIGNFYGPRTPEPLFNAISILNQEDASLLDNVKFEIIGDCPLEYRRMGEMFKNTVIFRDPVTYEESIKLMKSAYALILIDGDLEYNIFFPGKLAEYIGAGRPIIGITPPGTSANIISRLGGEVVSPKNPEKIAQILKRIIKAGVQRTYGQEELRERYHIKNISKEFENIIQSLLI